MPSYEKKVESPDGSFTKSFNYKPIQALNNNIQSNINRPVQITESTNQNPVESRDGGKD